MLLPWALTFLLRLAAAYTITVDSQQAGNEGSLAGDGNINTFWHTEFDPNVAPFPHWAIVDLGSAQYINGFNYFPRQDGEANGRIGNYKVELSNDMNTWTTVSQGTWLDDASMKQVGFNAVTVRYVRVTATSEAGNRGTWTSASEFNVNFAPTSNAQGSWGPVIALPIVPAAGFMEWNSGKVLLYSSYRPNQFSGTTSGLTYTSSYDPGNGAVGEKIVTNTQHDMFCPGMNLLHSGRAFITGGDDSTKTSVYDPTTDTWSAASTMRMGRGYHASTVLSNGKVFTIGGSWSGGRGGKNAEQYDPATNTWTLLPGCPVAPMLTNDHQGIFRQDNHGWLFAWKNAVVFQAGPSKAMNWYGTTENNNYGAQIAAGNRGNDVDSMNGNAVMYDAVAGKILTVGGATDYQDVDATNTAYIITLPAGVPGSAPNVRQIASMANQRSFANAVILPNGKVFVTGGQTHAVPFTDTTAVKTPELFDPATETWTTLPPHVVSRNYHSLALLMLDGRVFTTGGGVCGGCSANHADAQIYSPSYLFNGARPQITATSATILAVGATFTVTTNIACSSFSVIRYGSATHTVDTDQRRIPLTPTATNGNTYTFKLPSDAGIALPGMWGFWALTAGGVPSSAQTLKITL
jgi:galactose oxidase